MTGISRRAFIGSTMAGAAGLGLSHPAAADDDDKKPREFPVITPISIVLATPVPGDHPMNTRIRLATKRVVEDTHRFNIRMVTGGRLGSEATSLQQLRARQIHFLAVSPIALAALVQPAAASSIGFAFDNNKTMLAALDGALGTLIKAAITKAGFHVFDKVWSYGYRQITSANHAITTPDDLKNFKIAIPDDPATVGLFESFGAAPVKLPPDRMAPTLRGGGAEGRECELGDIVNAKLYEYQHYVSATKHLWDGFWLLANAETWKAFPPAVQGSMSRNFDQGALEYRDDLEKQDAMAIDDMKAKGMEFTEPDRKLFRAALRKANYYSTLKSKFDPKVWAALEKYSGKLT